MATTYKLSIALLEIDNVDSNKYTVNHFEIDIDENEVEPFKSFIDDGTHDDTDIEKLNEVLNKISPLSNLQNIKVKEGKYKVSMALIKNDDKKNIVNKYEFEINKDKAIILKNNIVKIQSIDDSNTLNILKDNLQAMLLPDPETDSSSVRESESGDDKENSEESSTLSEYELEIFNEVNTLLYENKFDELSNKIDNIKTLQSITEKIAQYDIDRLNNIGLIENILHGKERLQKLEKMYNYVKSNISNTLVTQINEYKYNTNASFEELNKELESITKSLMDDVNTSRTILYNMLIIINYIIEILEEKFKKIDQNDKKVKDKYMTFYHNIKAYEEKIQDRLMKRIKETYDKFYNKLIEYINKSIQLDAVEGTYNILKKFYTDFSDIEDNITSVTDKKIVTEQSRDDAKPLEAIVSTEISTPPILGTTDNAEITKNQDATLQTTPNVESEVSEKVVNDITNVSKEVVDDAMNADIANIPNNPASSSTESQPEQPPVNTSVKNDLFSEQLENLRKINENDTQPLKIRQSANFGGKKPRKSSNSSIKHRIKAHSSRNNIKKRTTRKN
jgi:hypothetical protein